MRRQRGPGITIKLEWLRSSCRTVLIVGGSFFIYLPLSAAAVTAESRCATTLREPTNDNETMEHAVQELLGILQDGHLLQNDAKARQRILQAIVEAADCNGALITPESAAQKKARNPAVGSTRILSEAFFYVKVREINPALHDELAEQMQRMEAEKYAGFIMDLRNAGGSENNALMTSADRIAAIAVPVIILVDRNTVGPAELFAEMLKEKSGAVLVGEPTKGYPFPLFVTQLQSGESIHLPKVVVPENKTPWKPSPLLPDVMVQSEQEESQDLPLAKAVDLLKTVQAFGHKHF